MRTDVAIVGAGVGGTAAALRLRSQGIAVVVLDRRPQRAVVAETLPPSAVPLLQELGVWPAFLATNPQAIHGNSSRWGTGMPLERSFLFTPYGSGWRIERDAFDKLLLRALDHCGATVLSHRRVVRMERGITTRWHLTLLHDGVEEQIAADVVIDASGRSRQVARLRGQTTHQYDQLVGMICLLQPCGAADPAAITTVEAVQDGWWYASPLQTGQLVVGYMTDRDDETARAARTAEGWRQLLALTVHVRTHIGTGDYTLAAPVQTVAAHSSQLSRTAGAGWCAVGDAAATHDPLSSFGLAAALDSGMRAAAAVTAADGGGLEHYAEDHNEHYARYLAQWLGYYALETRWAHRQFWWRRHEALRTILALPAS